MGRTAAEVFDVFNPHGPSRQVLARSHKSVGGDPTRTPAANSNRGAEMDWHVEMSFEGSESVFEDPAERDRFGDLIEVLPSVGVESPSLSFGSSGFGVSAAVSAATPLQALTIVEKGLQSAFQNAGLPMLPQVEARAVERSRFERDLDEPAGATN